ncbi:TonB-dependent receptor [Sphingobacterium bovistauri]|uniref:TonB-dependent receptor n=1 Tax=Sphingobacterium bovistauri TaxID=2781959 RepID=A0ABS7Z3Q9_9SPHI|nr:TonB-dependent receptor [Sphingobacterium bovistauri]MCA5004760.1 TonB-dependent receptor [Sphingobacterium bovistauri]
MTRITLIFINLFISFLSFGQQKIDISGKVINKETKEIVVHAFLKVGNQITVLTNHQGEFHLQDLPLGNLNLDISHIAYASKKISIDLSKDTIFSIELTPKSINLDEISIQKVGTTNTANTLKIEQRKESQGKNLAEVLADIAGVSTLKTGATIAKPMINGLFGNRIILLNNGTRHESQQWGLDHAPEIDPFAYQKISILKNAEAIRYGADALGGLVKMEPQDIVQNKLVAGSVNIGANSNGRGGFINTQLEGNKNNFSYRAGITGIKAGNLKTSDYYIGNTGKTELNGNILLQYKKNNHKIDLYTSHFGTELGIFQGAHIGTKEDIFARIAYGRPFENYDFSYAITAPKQTVNHQLAKLGYSYQIDNNQKLETYYSIQKNHRREYDLRRVQSDNTPMADIVLTTQQLEAVYKNRNTKIGVFGSLQINNNTSGTGTTPIIPNFDNHNVALFASHKINYGRHYAEIGARYDYKYFDAAGYRFAHDQLNSDGSTPQYLLKDRRDFSNFSGVIGNTLSLFQALTWKSNLALAWRAPSASELYSDGIHHGTGTYEIGNINLQSEQGLKWVNTITYKNQWLNLNADLFGQVIDNYIYSQPNPDAVKQTIRGTFPIFQYQQDDAVFYGLDLQAEVQLTQNWDYLLSFSSVRAKNTTKNSYLPYIPADRVQQAIAYNFLLRDNNSSYIKLKHQYQAKQSRYEANSDFAAPPAGYHTFDIIANTTWKTQQSRTISLLLSIENMFNTAYKDYLDRFRYYTHSIGRNTAIKINYTF